MIHFTADSDTEKLILDDLIKTHFTANFTLNFNPMDESEVTYKLSVHESECICVFECVYSL